MYLMPGQGDGPMPFGCLVQWHAHTNLCTSDTTGSDRRPPALQRRLARRSHHAVHDPRLASPGRRRSRWPSTPPTSRSSRRRSWRSRRASPRRPRVRSPRNRIAPSAGTPRGRLRVECRHDPVRHRLRACRDRHRRGSPCACAPGLVDSADGIRQFPRDPRRVTGQTMVRVSRGSVRPGRRVHRLVRADATASPPSRHGPLRPARSLRAARGFRCRCG